MHESRTLADRMSGRISLIENAGGRKTLAGKSLRSTVEQGKIIEMHLPKPPKNLIYLQAAEIPGSKKITLGGVSIPILPNRDIQWKGQEILLAAGPNPEEIEDWFSRVKIEVDNRAKEGEQRLTEQIFEKGNPDASFRDAFQVVEEFVELLPSFDTQQPSNAVCVRDGSHYAVHTATLWPGSVRAQVAKALKIDRGQIDIRSYPVYPSLRLNLWRPTLEACHAALLSQKAKRSVKISSMPSETAVTGLPGVKFKIRTAVDTRGRIMASKVDFTVFAGSFLPLKNEFFQRIVLGFFSFYLCEHYFVHGKITHTPLAPSNIGPAAGFELGFLAGESLASKIAASSTLTPSVWHRNSLRITGASFGAGILLPKDFPILALLDDGIKISDFNRKNAAYEQIRLARKLHRKIPSHYGGIGLSTAWFGNGFLSTSRGLSSASLSLTLGRDGKLEVGLPTHQFDDSLKEAWSRVLVNELRIDRDLITFSFKMPKSGLEPGPSILGRNISVYTRLLSLAANDLAKLRFREALPITVTRTHRRGGIGSWNANLLEGSPFEAISYCVGIIELSVSTITMEFLPVRVWLIIDGGNILALESAKARIEASVQETLRWCGFRQRGNQFPTVSIDFHKPKSKRQPKDVSTIPQLVIPAALLQAVRQAANFDVYKLPITPDSLIEIGKHG